MSTKECDVTCHCSVEHCELIMLSDPQLKSTGWNVCDVEVLAQEAAVTPLGVTTSESLTTSNVSATIEKSTTTDVSTTTEKTTTATTTSTAAPTTTTSTLTTTTASSGQYFKLRPIMQSW